MLNSLSRGEVIAGGVAAASVGLLAYTLTRPTKPKKVRKGGPRKPSFTKRFTKKPLDIHLAMSSPEGFHALVAADKKNKSSGLKYGAYLTKINDIKVRDWTHEAIMNKLTKVKVPCTLTFREEKELEEQFTEAETLKEKANDFYKKKQLKEAVEWLSQAIAKHPTNKVFYSNRVLMLLSLSDYEAALEDCRTIRILDPTSRYVKGHYLRGMVFMKKDEPKHAAAAFQTVLKIQPSFKQATDRLTDCMEKIDTLREEARRQRRESAAALKEKARLKREAMEAERLKQKAIEQAAEDKMNAEQSEKADLAASLLESTMAASAGTEEAGVTKGSDETDTVPVATDDSTAQAADSAAAVAAAMPGPPVTVEEDSKVDTEDAVEPEQEPIQELKDESAETTEVAEKDDKPAVEEAEEEEAAPVVAAAEPESVVDVAENEDAPVVDGGDDAVAAEEEEQEEPEAGEVIADDN